MLRFMQYVLWPKLCSHGYLSVQRSQHDDVGAALVPHHLPEPRCALGSRDVCCYEEFWLRVTVNVVGIVLWVRGTVLILDSWNGMGKGELSVCIPYIIRH